MKKLLLIAMSLLLILTLGIFGLIIGANYGGNYMTTYHAFGVTGYEATGIWGFILGSGLGVIIIAAYYLIKRKFH